MEINTYLIDNYFKCKWNVFSNQKKKWLNGKNTRSIYMLATTDSLQIQGHAQMKSERIVKDSPCKWKLKENYGGYICIRQNKL